MLGMLEILALGLSDSDSDGSEEVAREGNSDPREVGLCDGVELGPRERSINGTSDTL